MTQYRIESLLSARQFVQPQVVGDWIYFISDLSGRLSLYRMRVGGSVPEPLISPDIALPNPHLMNGYPYRVLPGLGKILLMLDKDGDENYQPLFLPVEGGIPEPVFGERFAGQQVFLGEYDPESHLAFFSVDPRKSPVYQSFRVNLSTLDVIEMGGSIYGNFPIAQNESFSLAVTLESYTAGDIVLYTWEQGAGERRLLFGKPLDQRQPGEKVVPNGIGACHLTVEGGLLMVHSIFDDHYSLGYFELNRPDLVEAVAVDGLLHQGVGEMTGLAHLAGNRYTISYNIDGSSWVYEGLFDEASRRMTIQRALVGMGELSNGVLESLDYEKATGRFVISFSTATSPSQIYLLDPSGALQRQTNERVLGISPHLLSSGEDYPYTSHDGLRISSRLYLPAAELGFSGPRPVIFYIHGGPQSQERPDFTWFSMPLIQFFTLNGFAVWVPNVRGSSGYGMSYMKRVDHDWGGLDRLDHVAAYELLKQDKRLDMSRVGVMGRSYGGYMTLTLVGRHPELWKAAVDMFGPYNLFSFMERLPETWKTYFYQAIGEPDRDHDFLTDRSPSTHLVNLACPLLVMQGANDPRVVEPESRDVVENLRAAGKQVDYVVYHDEGHDVIKFPNKVDCYNRIVGFFRQYLEP